MRVSSCICTLRSDVRLRSCLERRRPVRFVAVVLCICATAHTFRVIGTTHTHTHTHTHIHTHVRSGEGRAWRRGGREGVNHLLSICTLVCLCRITGAEQQILTQSTGGGGSSHVDLARCRQQVGATDTHSHTHARTHTHTHTHTHSLTHTHTHSHSHSHSLTHTRTLFVRHSRIAKVRPDGA